MDYTSLIRDAWVLTWRYRFLWVLGLFTGTAVGSCAGAGGGSPAQWQAGPGSVGPTAPGVDRAAGDVAQWVSSHPGIVIAAIAMLLLLGLTIMVVSIVAQGGMTEATVDLARRRPISLGQAWGAGFHFFWRYLGLVALLIAAAFALAAVIAAFVALAIGVSTMVSDAVRGVVIPFWIVVGILLLLLAIPVGIGVSIVIAFAQRVIVVENVGPVAAIRGGWILLRSHLGPSFMVWLINVGLGIAAGFVVVFALMAVVAVLTILGAILWAIVGFTAPVFIYIAFGVVVAIAALWGMQAIVNTFFWSYWTLAYLRLTGVQTEPVV